MGWALAAAASLHGMQSMSNITLSHCNDLLKPHATFQAFHPERKKLLLLPFGT